MDLDVRLILHVRPECWTRTRWFEFKCVFILERWIFGLEVFKLDIYPSKPPLECKKRLLFLLMQTFVISEASPADSQWICVCVQRRGSSGCSLALCCVSDKHMTLKGFLELTYINTSSSSLPCWTADGGETHVSSCVNACTQRALDSHYPASCWRLVKDSVAAESGAADEPGAACVRHLLPDSSWEWNADCLTKLSVNVCI